MSAVAEQADVPAGITMPSTPGGRSGFLADVIVELELADRAQVEKASEEARLKGRTLPDVLVEKGTVGERDVARAVAERHGLPMVDLESFRLDPEAAQLVGRVMARRYSVLPAGFAPDGSLMLAMVDPGDSLARNDVAVLTRLEVTPVIAARSQIEARVDDLPETGVRRLEPVGDSQQAPPLSGSMLWQSEHPATQSGGGQGVVVEPPTEDGAETHRLQSELTAYKSQAADLEVELIGVRSELDEVKGRHERKSTDLEAKLAALREQLGERDAQVARLEGDVAYRDGRLGELERQLEDRDAAVAGLEAELSAARRGE